MLHRQGQIKTRRINKRYLVFRTYQEYILMQAVRIHQRKRHQVERILTEGAGSHTLRQAHFQMTDGYAQSVLTYLRMQSKHLAVITYSVNRVLKKHLLVLFAI